MSQETLCEVVNPSFEYCKQLPVASDAEFIESTCYTSSEEYDLYESDYSNDDYIPYQCFSNEKLSESDETSSDNDSNDENGEWSDEDLDDPIVAMHAQEHLAEIGAMPAIAG